jgi:TatD DNase family protein
MILIDTHTHLYLESFKDDQAIAVERALEKGVKFMLLPNVDEETIGPLMDLHKKFPGNCLPMMGLHPTSVKPGFENILEKMKMLFDEYDYYAVGETGIDLYWDKTFFDQQVASFKIQLDWALEMDLPVVIHSRSSIAEIMEVLKPYRNKGLKGIMHCFPGDIQQAEWFIDFGFYLGIGGVVTYKNSITADVVAHVPLKHLLLETDAPYLPPVPFRGKRNEPAYLPYIIEKIALLKNITSEEVAVTTSQSALELFKIS